MWWLLCLEVVSILNTTDQCGHIPALLLYVHACTVYTKVLALAVATVKLGDL